VQGSTVLPGDHAGEALPLWSVREGRMAPHTQRIRSCCETAVRRCDDVAIRTHAQKLSANLFQQEDPTPPNQCLLIIQKLLRDYYLSIQQNVAYLCGTCGGNKCALN
jgi:hypothetical protein